MVKLYETSVNLGTDRVTITKKCTVTGQEYAVECELDKWRQWKDGAYIQDVMGDLTAEQREFLISGLTPMEWDKMFFLADVSDNEHVVVVEVKDEQ
jgi:hypothetical protein